MAWDDDKMIAEFLELVAGTTKDGMVDAACWAEFGQQCIRERHGKEIPIGEPGEQMYALVEKANDDLTWDWNGEVPLFRDKEAAEIMLAESPQKFVDEHRAAKVVLVILD